MKWKRYKTPTCPVYYTWEQYTIQPIGGDGDQYGYQLSWYWGEQQNEWYPNLNDAKRAAIIKETEKEVIL